MPASRSPAMTRWVSMLDRDAHESLLPLAAGDGDGEGWLMSYLDVLTLLITLFVLLLSLSGNGQAPSGNEYGGDVDRPISPLALEMARAVAGGPAPSGTGILPRHDGVRPSLAGLEIEGVSIAEDSRGITLRIDDNLLFASGSADLTAGGGQVMQRLMGTLQAIEGAISVEGHTDDRPIATARFPSNWELSTSRAIAVLRYLAAAGISESRLRAIGYADTRPLEANDTPEGRSANRRVELLLSQTSI